MKEESLTERADYNYSTLSDGELLARLYERDKEALGVLYDRYSGYVHALSLRMLGSRQEAEEVLQDVFWQFWKGRIRYHAERGRFSTWLFVIVRNRCLDRLRRMNRKASIEPLSEIEPEPDPHDPEEDVYIAERRQIVLQALGRLPEEQRQAVELAFYQGMTHSEIAAQLDTPLGTIKSRIKIGMEKLKQHLRSVESNDR